MLQCYKKQHIYNSNFNSCITDITGVTSYGALGHISPSLELVHVHQFGNFIYISNTTHWRHIISPVETGRLVVNTSTPHIYPHAVAYLLSSVFCLLYLCINFCDFCLTLWTHTPCPSWRNILVTPPTDIPQ